MEQLYELEITSVQSALLMERGVEPEPVNHVAFDPLEEILWSATLGGY